MKRRILFVDDDTMVLQGLQRMLRPLRDEWEMEFVDGGAKALGRMASVPFDVIVTDMMMPGMNGADLLEQVMQQYPNTVRLVLSGHADRELTLRCVGCAHQFLSKPCDPDSLKATVARASSGDAAFYNDQLKQLISKMDRLPSIPLLYCEIVNALRNPEAALADVGSIIAQDIAMTAKILKLVNSAFFGLPRQLSSPVEAATYLGLDTIRALVLSINAFSQFECVQLKGFSLESLWNHSMETAAIAKLITREETGDQKLAEEAFVAGMLHDTGKLILAANYPDEYNFAMRGAEHEGIELHVAENQVFDADHADVGGYLLGLWGLPVSVVEAISLHHHPGRTLQKTFSPLTAVHAANVLAHELDAIGSGNRRNQVDVNYLARLGLTDRMDWWREKWQENLLVKKIA